MQFKQLNIGDSFDFVSPERMLNSFFLRCTKVSARKYQDETGTVHRIGSASASVYHVRTAQLSVPERHQLRIARDTLKMNDVGASVLGGPSKSEAREIILRLTGKPARD